MSMQSHVYQLGLKQGQCSDVKVGAFGRVYSLHRLFLIQSGFFRAMLCGGYAEDIAASAAARHTRTASNLSRTASADGNDILALHFDDPNISRAAFEYCIAHLYGGGPQLVLPYWASPCSAHPLSPAFTIEFGKAQAVDRLENEAVGPTAHPATPRFLLSLLATSIYLNIPSITSQALTLVLCSLTPYTVSHYLRFAIGKGIEGTTASFRTGTIASEEDEQDEEWDWELQGPVRTLEELGRPLPSPRRQSDLAAPDQKQGSKGSAASLASQDEADLTQRTGEMSLGGPAQRSGPSSAGLKRNRESFGGEDASDGYQHMLKSSSSTINKSSTAHAKASADSSSNAVRASDAASRRSAMRESLVDDAAARRGSQASRADARRKVALPDFHYGLPADRIGEACACWLARWGLDVLDAEDVAEQVRSQELQDRISAQQQAGDLHKLSAHAGRILTGEVDLLGPSLLPTGEMPDTESPLSIPYVRVWSYPAMPSSWVRALISSDSFFVRSEWDRYTFAKRVVEMRRLQKERLSSIDAYLWSEYDDDDDEDAVSDTTGDGFESASTTNRAEQSSPSPPGTAFRGFGFNGPTSARDRGDSRSDSRLDRSARSKGRRPSSSTKGGTLGDEDSLGEGDDGDEDNDEDEDEAEYTQLFSSGIYYTHMSFQELNKISCDLSPTTGRPYTPLSVLQAALWAGSELKNHVLSCGKGSRAPTLPLLDGGDTEANLDGSWAAGPSLESHNGVQIPPLADGNVDLGVSSALGDFVQACEGSSGPSLGRKRGSTPLLQSTGLGGFGLDSSPSMQSLGGRGATPLLTGSAGGSGALLSKRYYLVPSDDTVRLGDGLLAICGQSHGGSSSSEAKPAQGGDNASAGRPSSPTASSAQHHSLGATGNAAVQLPNTVPLPAPPPAPESISAGMPRKDRRHFFGIANAVATGRELGEKGHRASSESRRPLRGPAARLRRDERGETPSLRQYGSLPADGDDASGADHFETNDYDGEDHHSGGIQIPSQIERWTGYEPMRLGVEFFGVDLLPEKQRLYSPTFFYAGSIWNLYVQAIKKAKGIQLGIYLHRQSPSESLPQPSAPLPTQPVDASPSTSQMQDGSGHAAADSADIDSPIRGYRRSLLLASRLQPGGGEAGVGSFGRASPRPHDNMLGSSSLGGSFAAVGESNRNSSQFDVSTPQRRDGGGGGSFLDAATSTPQRTGGISLHNTPLGGNDAAGGMGATLTLPGGTTLSSLGFNGMSPTPSSSMTDTLGGPSAAGGGAGGLSSRPSSSIARPTSMASHLSGVASAGGGGASASSPGPSGSQSGGPGGPSGSASNSVPIVPLCPGGPAVYQVCPTPSISYRDPRRMLRAYFSIHCPSPFGNALTRFSSAPDYFSLSQSWGWKSSSLLGVAYLEGGKLGEGRSESWGTFRCVCTVGVV